MNYKISDDRKRLTITVTPDEREMLKRMDEEIHQDATMHDWFEPLIANSELEWINPRFTGDLTSAPMLGTLGEDQDAATIQEQVKEHYGLVPCGFDGHFHIYKPILSRFAFMSYQVRSVLQDLRDKGEVTFTS